MQQVLYAKVRRRWVHVPSLGSLKVKLEFTDHQYANRPIIFSQSNYCGGVL